MKHYIIVKWNDKVTDKAAFAKRAEEIYSASLSIPGVEGYRIILSNSERKNRFDLMIEMTLSVEGLENYDKSDMHKLWKTEMGEFFEAKAIFDCD